MKGFCVGLARVFFNKAALISTPTSSTWECIFSLCYRIWKGYCRRYIWKGGHWTRSEIKGLSHQPYLSLPDLSSPFQHPQPRSVTWETEPYCPPACLGSFADWGGDIAKCRPQSEFRLCKKSVTGLIFSAFFPFFSWTTYLASWNNCSFYLSPSASAPASLSSGQTIYPPDCGPLLLVLAPGCWQILSIYIKK